MDLKKLQEKTAEVNDLFPTDFDKRDTVIDLVEEVGELAQAVLIVEKRKFTSDPAKVRTVRDVANALGDIMYDLLLLANKYDLDMDKEYLKVLNELMKRAKSGEFEEVLK